MTRTTILYILLVVVAGIAVLGWMRPVEVITTEDPYKAKYDSLMHLAKVSIENANISLDIADAWHAKYDSLRAIRLDTDAHVHNAEEALRNADVDSLRSVLMQRPR